MTATLDRPPTAPTEPAEPDARKAPAAEPLVTRTLRVFRQRRDEHQPHWDRFDYPVPSPRATILDALTWIRRRLDPTLDVRHSCFHASCGTCGMRVNGREVLACVTRLEDLGAADREITVEPLLNQPLMSDLVVDIEALYEALEAVGMPLIRAAEPIEGGQPAAGVPVATRFEDCLECGLCLSACPVAATDPSYAGPGVLAAAWRILEEPRDADVDWALAHVDGEHGAWRCHLAFECNEACPSDDMPAEKIMHLRRGLLRHRLAAALGRGRTAAGSGA